MKIPPSASPRLPSRLRDRANEVQGSRRRRSRRALLSVAASLAMAMVGIAAPLASGSAFADEVAGGIAPIGADPAQPSQIEPPGPNASDAQWRQWSRELFENARDTDWAKDSAQRGCTLISVDISRTTLPKGTLENAPAGLDVPVVNRDEKCGTQAGSDAQPDSNRAFSAQMAASSACRSTSGPGTICLNRSGSYLTASFTYRGSGSPQGIIRIYSRSTSSGCGTGTIRGTSSMRSYSKGTTHSVSAYAPARGSYSAAFWHDLWIGSTNWGTVCGVL